MYESIDIVMALAGISLTIVGAWNVHPGFGIMVMGAWIYFIARGLGR